MTEQHDPLDALRADVVPVRPDAAFAARLRARLESALLNPEGDTMSDTTQSTRSVAIQEESAHEGDVVYASLWLPDLARAETFYTAVLGWHLTPAGPDDRRVTDVRPMMGLAARTENALLLCHGVADLDAALERITAAGGQAGVPTDEGFGRFAECLDNQGMRMAVLHVPVDQRRPVPRPGAGELFYLTVEVPDSQSYRDFYGAVFGWTFAPGRVDDGWSVTGVSPMTGMRGGAERPVIVPMFGVPDVTAAVATIRAAGGTSTDPEQQPYGTTANCEDDQGTRFYIGQV